MMLIETKPLLIHVLGKPAPQGSKISTKKGYMMEASQYVAPWRNQVVSACVDQRINEGKVITCPVKIEIDFTFFRPKSHYGTGKNKNLKKLSAPRFPTKKNTGDIDKLCRSTLDGLSVTSGGVLLEDDSLVTELIARKIYVPMQTPNRQGAWIRITQL
tara:strand:- start:6098 stop:6571 length:474 start_codon:yes stop_codon:yes gene_type:complete